MISIELRKRLFLAPTRSSGWFLTLWVGIPMVVSTVVGGKWMPRIFASNCTSNILVHRDNYATFKNGSATKEALRTGGSASGRYEVVTGGASVDVGIQTMFNDQFSYALFEAREQSLEVQILNYGKLINDESMENQIASLPPFNKSDKFSLRSYRSLFETSGTHIITEVSYGARLSLVILYNHVILGPLQYELTCCSVYGPRIRTLPSSRVSRPMSMRHLMVLLLVGKLKSTYVRRNNIRPLHTPWQRHALAVEVTRHSPRLLAPTPPGNMCGSNFLNGKPVSNKILQSQASQHSLFGI